jgi:hypothetical protein
VLSGNVRLGTSEKGDGEIAKPWFLLSLVEGFQPRQSPRDRRLRVFKTGAERLSIFAVLKDIREGACSLDLEPAGGAPTARS